jgi:hypothetical protein
MMNDSRTQVPGKVESSAAAGSASSNVALVSPHGAAKQAEATDPLDLVGTVVPGGDIELLARCFVEEFAAMGYDGEQIFELFRQPQYVGVHPVYLAKGEEGVRHLIEEVLAECGVFRVTESIAEEPPPPRSKLAQIEPWHASNEDDQP